MKILRQLLFMAVLVIGFSVTAMAQRQDDNKKPRPPKENTEIRPEDKKPKEDKPKNDNRNNDNRGKKPQYVFISSGNQSETTSV